VASHILLVDDSATVRTIVKVYLTGLPFEFLEAGNGIEALELLKTRRVDLVIADVNMPGMDGVTFLQRLRASADPELRKLRVILLTGEQSEDIRSRGVLAGANAFVRKPVSNTDLRAAIETVLKQAA
jgi:two-component system, chemotaxis family, chemotaxis protein CheY